jgi:hypothetical protein
VAFAQSGQVINRHGGDAANRDCADRCSGKQAQGHIFHRKSPFLSQRGPNAFRSYSISGRFHLAAALLKRIVKLFKVFKLDNHRVVLF